jgi:hypothetical protein
VRRILPPNQDKNSLHGYSAPRLSRNTGLVPNRLMKTGDI